MDQVFYAFVFLLYIVLPIVALYYLKRIQLGLKEVSKLLLEMKAICERIRIKIK